MKEPDDVLLRPRKFQIEKDESGKYNNRDSLKIKTTGYQWFRKNNGGGKILRIKNPENKYTVSGDFNLGDVSALWAVESSSSTEGWRLQDRAKERLQHRACPSSNTFEEYARMRTSCYILEERNGDFYCDCYEGCKGKLCKHSVGMDYFVGNLIVEDDVRAVPLGGKRKRGRPKRNPHCLTRSPYQTNTADNVQAGDENVADDIEEYDIQSLPASPDNLPADIDAQPGQEVEVMPDNTEEDFCLQLEDSCSGSDDMDVIGSEPAFQYKPPKKAKRDVTEVLLASRGRGRGRVRRDTTGERRRVTTSPSLGESRLSPTRRGRGRPRGRVGRAMTGGRGRGRAKAAGRGRGITTASRSTTAASPQKRGRGRPRKF